MYDFLWMSMSDYFLLPVSPVVCYRSSLERISLRSRRRLWIYCERTDQTKYLLRCTGLQVLYSYTHSQVENSSQIYVGTQSGEEHSPIWGDSPRCQGKSLFFHNETRHLISRRIGRWILHGFFITCHKQPCCRKGLFGHATRFCSFSVVRKLLN